MGRVKIRRILWSTQATHNNHQTITVPHNNWCSWIPSYKYIDDNCINRDGYLWPCCDILLYTRSSAPNDRRSTPWSTCITLNVQRKIPENRCLRWKRVTDMINKQVSIDPSSWSLLQGRRGRNEIQQAWVHDNWWSNKTITYLVFPRLSRNT